MDMGVKEPNFLWLLAFNAFLAYFTNLTNFLVHSSRLPRKFHAEAWQALCLINACAGASTAGSVC